MDMFSAEFFTALAAIVVIDLVLAGDNAIVIALAARSLPDHLRKKAILWGTFGAVAVRSAMTVAVVWLLKIPGLMLAGGVMLVWIAYKLLADNSDEQHNVNPASGFWGALKTIVIADAVMGLDNVLAVAGAAHGSFLLVVLGLLISIPIVVWGSQIVLKLMDRFPAVIYIGAAVLAATSAKMITSEAMLADYLDGRTWIVVLTYLVIMGGVLGGGYLAKSRASSPASQTNTTPVSAVSSSEGVYKMKKVLIPIDGSESSLEAVRHVANSFHAMNSPEVHLLHVTPLLRKHAARFIPRRDRKAFYRDEAQAALGAARDILNRHSIGFSEHAETGEIAPTIDRIARKLKVDEIAMGTHRKSALVRMVQGSVCSQLMEITTIPVRVVALRRSSPMVRFGIPAGLGAAIAALVLAID